MTQTQREAIIDLLHLSTFTDSHLSLKEDEALQSALNFIGWEAELPREIFLANSMNRARKAADTDAATTAFLATRAEVFTDETSRADALELIQRVLARDGIASSESAFLDRLRAAF